MTDIQLSESKIATLSAAIKRHTEAHPDTRHIFQKEIMNQLTTNDKMQLNDYRMGLLDAVGSWQTDNEELLTLLDDIHTQYRVEK